MDTFEIRLYETRMTEDNTDDVALFDVICQGGKNWRIPVFLSPLFRVLWLGAMPLVETRREMIVGLGMRAIVDRLVQGLEPPFEDFLVFATDYPGSPGEPTPLFFEQVIVRDGKVKAA